MTYINELTTLADVRATRFSDDTSTKDDALLLDMIREAGRIIDSQGKRHFMPRVDTRLYDLPPERTPAHPFSNLTIQSLGVWSTDEIYFDDDLLSLTTLLNGDGTVILSSQYLLTPANQTPKYSVKLRYGSGLTWQFNSSGEAEQVVSVTGIWGYHDDYNNAWELVTTLGAAISSTSTTSATLTSGVGNAGELWKIDNELLYLSARSNTTATITRGVNGSTAATHLINAPIYRWRPGYEISRLAIQTTIFNYMNRVDPRQDSVMIDGKTIAIPKDVTAFVQTRINALGLKREAFG